MDSHLLDQLGVEQRGLVTSAQAVQLLGRRRKERWVAAGRLVRVQPRVWRVVGAPITWEQHLLAAQLSSDGLVSHRSSAHLWGMLRSTPAVEVAVPFSRNPRLDVPAVAHRSVDIDQEQALDLNGFRVTGPARTILDLGLVLPPQLVADALSIGLTKRLLTTDDAWDIRRRLSKCGRNGVGILDALLLERSEQPRLEESVLEARTLALLRRSGLPTPVVQHEIWAGDRLIARVDLAYPEIHLAIELDGFSHHASLEAFQRDRTRQNEIVALGWTVLRFTWDDVVRRPEQVVAAISRALATRSA